MPSSIYRWARILLLPLVVVFPLAADDVYLTNGRVFEDVIAEVDASTVRIRLAFGEMRFSLAAVERIEQVESSLLTFQTRRDALVADPSASAAEWIELSRWALASGQTHAAREAALRAAEKNPRAEGIDELMRGLDYVYDEQLGRWIAFEESMHLKGFEQVDGTWLSAEQRLARSQAEAEAARQREADQERRLTQAVLALAAAQLTSEPEPQVVYQWPVGVWANPFVWQHPAPHPAPHSPPAGHHSTAIPIERRQPGSLFPVASHYGGMATGKSGG